MSDGKKKFKDTKVGQFLSGAAPHILGDVANEVPGVGLIKTIAKVVAGDPGMSADQKMEFARLAAEEEQNAMFKQDTLKRFDGWLTEDWLVGCPGWFWSRLRGC